MRDDVRVARRPGWYVALALTVAVTVAVAAGGCGTASPESPPSGVDELEIPTPSPDPADFVSRIDNPWLPLGRGATWTYDVTGETSGRLTVEVQDEQVPVAGVDTTAVSRTGPDGVTVVDYYAQDQQGNVWWFGRAGEWQAGVDGAEAGVAMPAVPRLGDGWRAAYDQGEVDVVVSVATTDHAATTPAGQFDDLVGLDTQSPLTPGVATRAYYADGVGLVEEVSTSGPLTLVKLVSGPG